jgi:hypothetical protein
MTARGRSRELRSLADIVLLRSSTLGAGLRRLMLAILACATSAAAAAAPAVSAGYLTEANGFVDIDLPITQIAQDPGLTRIIARGVILGKELGFEVDFPSGPRGQTSLAPGTAQIRTLGAVSDQFVAFLDSRYKIPIPSKTMVAAVAASVVGLEGNPAHVQDGVTRMKFLFFESGPQDRYAEVYINVDAGKRVLGFHEKDEDYRKALLLALTQGP